MGTVLEGGEGEWLIGEANRLPTRRGDGPQVSYFAASLTEAFDFFPGTVVRVITRMHV